MRTSYSLRTPRFIVLEGGDGSGKTTCRKVLFHALASRGRPPLSLAGVSWSDVEATEIITKAKYFEVAYSPGELLSAYVRDRMSLGESLIRPALARRDVISDRYLLSDIVYNTMHYGLPVEATSGAFAEADLAEPDELVFLDTPPEVAVERLKARGRPINHWETLEKQKRVYDGFRRLLEDNPLGWKCSPLIIDNTRSPQVVQEDILKRILGIEPGPD